MEPSNQIQIWATGFADAAYRMALEAQKYEEEGNLDLASKAHKEVSKNYSNARREYRTTVGYEAEVAESLQVLAKTHERQAKNLEIKNDEDSSISKLLRIN
jgi:hypothetical protein